MHEGFGRSKKNACTRSSAKNVWEGERAGGCACCAFVRSKRIGPKSEPTDSIASGAKYTDRYLVDAKASNMQLRLTYSAARSSVAAFGMVFVRDACRKNMELSLFVSMLRAFELRLPVC